MPKCALFKELTRNRLSAYFFCDALAERAQPQRIELMKPAASLVVGARVVLEGDEVLIE